MIDRLAKAAEEAAEYDWQHKGQIDSTRWVQNWPEVVRAVLREMREPTPKMICEGHENRCPPEWSGSCAERIQGEWRAMIDTILNEKSDDAPKP